MLLLRVINVAKLNPYDLMHIISDGNNNNLTLYFIINIVFSSSN